MNQNRVLISGGGIAGLTLAIALKQHGFEPLLIEREPAPRGEGYMMDFSGTGWDVAERMGLIERLRAFRYPIDALEYVDDKGTPYLHVPIARIRSALRGKYTYLRRPDLERVLTERARELDVTIRYGAALMRLEDKGDHVAVRFEDGGTGEFALVFGADGVHSRVRRLAFGMEHEFSRFLGLYVAAFHVPRHDLPIGREVRICEEPDRMAMIYPLDDERLDATYIFRHSAIDVPRDRHLDFLRERYRGAGWIAEDVLRRHTGDAPIFFDSATQIAMPQWHRGRVALLGDACGCLTLLAGQGSHMAMAGGYVLAQELARHDGHETAFAAYQAFLRPPVEKRRKDAERMGRLFVPTPSSRPWLRHLTMRLLFNRALLKYGVKLFGADSVLAGY